MPFLWSLKMGENILVKNDDWTSARQGQVGSWILTPFHDIKMVSRDGLYYTVLYGRDGPLQWLVSVVGSIFYYWIYQGRVSLQHYHAPGPFWFLANCTEIHHPESVHGADCQQ